MHFSVALHWHSLYWVLRVEPPLQGTGVGAGVGGAGVVVAAGLVGGGVGGGVGDGFTQRHESQLPGSQ